jgi:hypothetical protein
LFTLQQLPDGGHRRVDLQFDADLAQFGVARVASPRTPSATPGFGPCAMASLRTSDGSVASISAASAKPACRPISALL